jgi:type VI secretion system protein ImpM
MASLGDFFHLQLEASFIRTWDGWVQKVLAESRTALAERWQACYLTAPIWRFSLHQAVVGAPMSGVMMPSVDRVGRMFPLTLVARGGCVDEACFAALEDVALATLDAQMGRDDLAKALAQVHSDGAGVPPDHGSRWEAMLEDTPLQMTCAGLPAGRDAQALFDLACWPEASISLEQARP